ncbi:Protein of unknown function [Bacillus toyonensis]|nr:Protein of unknown function [Bacillus toyonensis]
MEMNRE